MSGGFEDLGLLPELVHATADLGWVLPSAVQDEAIPLLLGGGDVMVAAETGSGKTAAFALPAIQLVHETRRAHAAAAAAAAASMTASAGEGGSNASKRARVQAAVSLSQRDRSSLMACATEPGAANEGSSAPLLRCQARHEREWCGVRATAGLVSGRAYFEVTVADEGLVRVGWSTAAGGLALGGDYHGWGYGGTAKRSHGNKFEDYGATFGSGDVIGAFAELRPDGSGGTLAFTKNGEPLGVAFTLPPRTGPLFPALCMRNAEVRVNFGGTRMAYAPPAGLAGYTPLEALAPHELAQAAEAGPAAGASANAEFGPVVIILEPMRDLAEQTHTAVEALCKYVVAPPVAAACFIGGVDKKEVTRQLAVGAPDIVTATPGKLLDVLESRKLRLGQVRLLVLDEADRFADDESFALVSKIFGLLCAGVAAAAAGMAAGGAGASAVAATVGAGAAERLQVCFFSATLHSPGIARLSSLMCRHPTWVDLKGRDAVPDTVHHLVVDVDADADRSWQGARGADCRTDRVHAGDPSVAAACAGGGGGGNGRLSAEALSEGTKRLKQRMLLALVDGLRMSQCLVFCRTNVDCDNLEAFLVAAGGGTRFRPGMERGKENRYSCVVLAGMRGMDERRRSLEAFKAGDARLLLCTDVAARGLDVKELPYVINMTLPDETENYIHRIGRVGRADHMGLAISLVGTAREKVWYHTCASRGASCSNSNLRDAGGCAIWYDEPALLRAVQRRLGVDADQGGAGIARMPVTRLPAPPPSVAPAPAVKTPAAAGAGADADADAEAASTATPAPDHEYAFTLPPEYAAVAYGAEREDGDAAPNAHVDFIRDHVVTLADLERRAQASFLSLRARFNVATV